MKILLIELFRLFIGHAVGDFVLQSGDMAQGKNRRILSPLPPGQIRQIMWPYWLTAHALIHGACVWFVTGSVSLAVAETVAHGVIDFGKCEGWYGVHLDQALHGLCKLAWVLAAQAP